MKTIYMHPSPWERTFMRSKKGAVFHVELHGCDWPPELRAKPPRVRLLEDAKGRPAPVLCEILDPWPGAPRYYPKEWEPGAPPNPHSIYGIYPPPER
jgi:hypothetical protein